MLVEKSGDFVGVIELLGTQRPSVTCAFDANEMVLDASLSESLVKLLRLVAINGGIFRPVEAQCGWRIFFDMKYGGSRAPFGRVFFSALGEEAVALELCGGIPVFICDFTSQ